MFDNPHKTEPDALKELRQLDSLTRRHLHGLLERIAEGLIILVFHIFLVIAISSIFPTFTQGLLGLILFFYVAFSVYWTLRPINEIHKAVTQSFTKEELLEGKTYQRYCMSGWFLRTIGGLIFATVLYGILYYFIRVV